MPRSRAARKGRKVTPAKVKVATRAILSDAKMLARVRAVEARNRSGAAFDEKSSRSFGSAVMSRQVVTAPVSSTIVSRTRRGVLADMIGLRFCVSAAQILSGGAITGVPTALYFIPSSTLAGSCNFMPFAIADTIWGISAFTDMMKHFQRFRVRNLSLVIEPFGSGASTTSGASVTVMPAMGGLINATFNVVAGANTPLNFSAVRSSKGAIDFPLWETIRIPMQDYVRGYDADRTFGIPSTGAATQTGSTAALNMALTIPCYAAISGFWPTAPAVQTTVANCSWEGELDLLDFQGLSWTNPIGLKLPPTVRSDEKELPPRSVLADRGQNLPPPDDRSWVVDMPHAIREHVDDLRRPAPICLESRGVTTSVGNVKPTEVIPNGRRGV